MISNAANNTYPLSCVHGGKMIAEQKLTVEEQLVEKIMDLNAQEKFIFTAPNGDICWKNIHEAVCDRIRTAKAYIMGAKLIAIACSIITGLIVFGRLLQGTGIDIYYLSILVLLTGANISIAYYNTIKLQYLHKQDTLLRLLQNATNS